MSRLKSAAGTPRSLARGKPVIRNQAKPRVVIADDHPEMLERVASILRPEFDVLFTAHDGLSAWKYIRELEPDIAVLDLYLPGMNGLEIVRALKPSGSRTVVVIMSGYDDFEITQEAIKAGALAFILKARLGLELVPVMRQAAQRAGLSR